MDVNQQSATESNMTTSTGHYITAWRIHKEMTKDRLAHLAGLSPSMISQLERGAAAYTQRNLTKIAAALEIEPWQLLAYDPNDPLSLSEDIKGGDLFWQRIPPRNRKKARLLITTNYDAAVSLALELFAKDE